MGIGNKPFFWSAVTVLVGLLWFLLEQIVPAQDTRATFENATTDFGPLETITGVPFRLEEGQAIITEPLAHLRVPFTRTTLAKRLVLTTTFRVENADVFEVGIRRGSFWLDYERVPLEHRVLDDLANEKRSGWNILRSAQETLFLNPTFPAGFSSFDDVLLHPPTDGVIGLYGNTTLDAPGVRVAPFRVSDDPRSFRVVYARYVPTRGAPTDVREVTRTFSLDHTYQNPDGSFDIMYVAQRADGKPPRVLLKDIHARIEPTLPTLSASWSRVQTLLRDTLIRPQAP